jgi:hypothetical protein
MKLGTQIRFTDGREGTVVFNSLIGEGILWGLHDPDPADFEGTNGNLLSDSAPPDFQWEPEALLRDPFPGCERCGFTAEQCVGDDFEITRVGLT